MEEVTVIFQTDEPTDVKLEPVWPEDNYTPSDIKLELEDDYDQNERLMDFDGIDIPDVSDFKTEYDKVYAEYFRVTACDMPPDPVVEAQNETLRKIKLEYQAAEEAKIKIEKQEELPAYLQKDPCTIPREMRCYKCRVCDKVVKTKYEFFVHVNTHPAKCVNCHVVYESWKKLDEHEVYCSRRFGRIILSMDPRLERQRNQTKKKSKKYLFKCSFCKRQYEKYEHLYDHQVNRCKKRYKSKNWVVKI